MDLHRQFADHRALEAALDKLFRGEISAPGMTAIPGEARRLVVAYYGPTDAKRDPRTRCMEAIHNGSPPGSVSELMSLAIDGDRVLVFQHRPPEMPDLVVSIVATAGPSWFAESRRVSSPAKLSTTTLSSTSNIATRSNASWVPACI